MSLSKLTFDPSFQNCSRRVKAQPRSFHTLANRTEFSENMANHVDRLMRVVIGVSDMNHALARSHAFFYVMAGVKIHTSMAAEHDWYIAPQASDADVDLLATAIEATPWDCLKVQSLLFDNASVFSHAQAWSLATAMSRSYFAFAENRHLAFAMGTSTRLGEGSPVFPLDNNLIRLIGSYTY